MRFQDLKETVSITKTINVKLISFCYVLIVWDGKLVLMGSDGHVLQEKREAAGLSVCRAVHRKDVAIVGRDDGWLSVHSGT